MKRPMSDAEYAAGAGVSCPFCGSGDLEVIEGPQVDGRDCWQEVETEVDWDGQRPASNPREFVCLACNEKFGGEAIGL